MQRAEKANLVQDLSRTLRESSSVLLLSFSGVNVPDITELRRNVSRTGSRYRVIKNRLALRAIEDTALGGFEEHFEGPTAIAFTRGDPVALAKVLKEFIKTHPDVGFKAGLVEGAAVTAADVEQLADLPSRSELLSKLSHLLNAPLTRLALSLQSPLRGLASLLGQLEGKKEE